MGKRDLQYFRKDKQIKLENELNRIYILHTYEKDLKAEEIIDVYKNL